MDYDVDEAAEAGTLRWSSLPLASGADAACQAERHTRGGCVLPTTARWLAMFWTVPGFNVLKWWPCCDECRTVFITTTPPDWREV